MTVKLFSGSRAVGTVLSFLLIAIGTVRAEAGAREYWISTNRMTFNLGTSNNPFNGSTQYKFDTAMNWIPAHSIIHIMPGTYQTKGLYGGYSIKTGQKLAGSGMDVTILKFPLGLRVGGSGAVMIGCNQPVTDSEVCDLTCDCNRSNRFDTYSGVELAGTHNAVRRVKVINCAHFGGNTEAWGIELSDFAPMVVKSEGNIIEQCEVSHFNYAGGGGISAITISDGSGIIRSNRVILDGGSFGLNGSWNHDVLIEGNFVEAAVSGLHGDTGGSTNVIVIHNTFKDCNAVCDFGNTFRRNLTFAFNDIVVSNTCYPKQALGFAFRDDHGGAYANILILGNRVGYSASPGSTENDFVYARNVSGLVMADNVVDSHLTNDITKCSNVNESRF